jgi:hypothetical protein
MFLLFFITYFASSFGQNHIRRDPDPRKDFANVFYKSSYTLFDMWSDEPIFPSADGLYNIFYATNEDKTPRQIKVSPRKLEEMTVYKFKNYSNCSNWCDGISYKENSSSTSSNSKSSSTSNQCGYCYREKGWSISDYDASTKTSSNFRYVKKPGYKICETCGGTGDCRRFGCSGGKRDCPGICTESGVCRQCNGERFKICNECRGTGIRR